MLELLKVMTTPVPRPLSFPTPALLLYSLLFQLSVPWSGAAGSVLSGWARGLLLGGGVRGEQRRGQLSSKYPTL